MFKLLGCVCVGAFAVFVLFATVAYLSSCAPPELNEDVVVSESELITCWNTLVAGTPGNFPPYDVMVTAVALKQRAGGSWKPCTCTSNLSGCTCLRLIGSGHLESSWVGLVGGTAHMTAANFLSAGTGSPDIGEDVFAYDWDDDVFWHANTVTTGAGNAGTIAVTLSSGNTWNVHHCVTQ